MCKKKVCKNNTEIQNENVFVSLKPNPLAIFPVLRNYTPHQPPRIRRY